MILFFVFYLLLTRKITQKTLILQEKRFRLHVFSSQRPQTAAFQKENQENKMEEDRSAGRGPEMQPVQRISPEKP
ncbi:MAG: hypothetical protein ACI350_08400 [Prevotella sp.]